MRPKFFYGYVILALCLANMVVMRGVTGSFSVYYLALLETFPWTHSDGASIASANFIVYALASPLVGLTFNRFGPRLLMPLEEPSWAADFCFRVSAVRSGISIFSTALSRLSARERSDSLATIPSFPAGLSGGAPRPSESQAWAKDWVR